MLLNEARAPGSAADGAGTFEAKFAAWLYPPIRDQAETLARRLVPLDEHHRPDAAVRG